MVLAHYHSMRLLPKLCYLHALALETATVNDHTNVILLWIAITQESPMD